MISEFFLNMSADQALVEKAKALVVLKSVLGDLYESHKTGILDGLVGLEMVGHILLIF